ncbi:MAG: glycosyltransferase family 1 protein, partial [Acidobacteria bacterium]|nr:glycosyltransferase family 1 protein [Acidobacteriota bacterium]
MRILHADTGTGWRGGQQQILWLMEGLRALGAEQMLLAPPGAPLWERARREGFAVAELMSPVVSRQNLRMLRRKAEGCDLLHAHDARA